MSTFISFSDGNETPEFPELGPRFHFRSLDGRQCTFRFSDIPCPGLHAELRDCLAAALASVNTLSTAQAYFACLRRFLACVFHFVARPEHDQKSESAF